MRNKMPPTCRVPPSPIQPPGARGMVMSLLPQVLTALGPPQPPRIKMVSLSITIWGGQKRVSAREGFLARPPRADRGRFSLHRRCWGLCARDEEWSWDGAGFAWDRAGYRAHPTPCPKPVPLSEERNHPSQSSRAPTPPCKGGEGAGSSV